MTNKKRVFASILVFLLCVAGISVIAFWPFGAKGSSGEKKPQERFLTRIITPSATDIADPDLTLADYLAYDESYILKAPLNEGEAVISVLNYDFDNSAIEDQVAAYYSLIDKGSPVSIAFLGYDAVSRTYRRLWNLATAAVMPGTVSLYTNDLLGDRSPCVIVTGMNAQREHTMTVFRKDPLQDKGRPFTKIVEITMDGSITVQEPERSLAYRQGIAKGQPFVITAGGRDAGSGNMLDRIEIEYAYNSVTGIYQQSKTSRIPGSQIEQRRLREVLTGEPAIFENFINDLWYHVSPQGTIDKSQYLYFDPVNREIIFFGDDAQQVFAWQRSTSTRYGLYISSQNISVTTLRRFVDIEMESLDSIRMRVVEDVRLKIGVSATWDGLYRRAGTAIGSQTEKKNIRPYTDAIYDSSIGRLRFHSGGEYELSFSGALTKGRYAFFRVGDQELLELRPERDGANAAKNEKGEDRFIYSLASADKTGKNDVSKSENLSLLRVRLGASGIQELHETPIILTRAQ